VTADRIEFSNGSFIQALDSNYRGAAGVNPTMVIADEIWAFTSESSQRLWDECAPSPTKKPSVRMVTSYAGFTGESALLEGMVKRGLAGEEVSKDLYVQPGMIAFISHDRIAPWQSSRWLEEARQSTRPSAFVRQYLNHFSAGETNFVDMADYDRCVDPDSRPVLSDPRLSVWLGLDGSVVHDSTAIAAVTFDHKEKKVRLVAHRIFVPSRNEPIDFSAVEEELLALRRRFAVRQVMFDPFQLVALSQRMTTLGLPMEPFAQTSSNLEAASNNLAELIRHRNLVAYPDADIRLALSHTTAVETPRGMRIAKEKASHRIDVIAALSFACLAAVREGQFAHDFSFRTAPGLPQISVDGSGRSFRDSQGRLRDLSPSQMEKSQPPFRQLGEMTNAKSRRWRYF
jgi:phage terminase large subunit-like protein